MERIEKLAAILDRHSAPLGEGLHPSAIPRLTLVRYEGPSEQVHTLYRPSVCIVAQGAKRTIAGGVAHDYAPGQYLTVSIDMPVIGQVIRAAPDAPYLSLQVDIDPAIFNDLLIESGEPLRDDGPRLGLQVSTLGEEALDAATRLAGLLDNPQAAASLAPLYERELCYFLLHDAQGARLRQLVLANSRTAQIAKAVRWINDRFRESITIEEAADEACMSPSTFYEHFKAVTGASPLQYQKQMRLLEARRLLLANADDAASAAFAVGYASPQQFSREYSRMFGAPPQRDAARLRAQTAAV